ncbi:LysR family transcriptional regulator [Dactylosporangium sp. NPDC051485]|uniref:LysR family transcriptional regulator n=1 Tax=Dactylosporangium sp. NPDC051485 TaxID=3154846 RepID=UPI003423E651
MVTIAPSQCLAQGQGLCSPPAFFKETRHPEASGTANRSGHLYAERMNLELRHYRLFATVAECQSFSAAGRQLGMTQPSVSRGVAAIERRLSARLVVRTTRRFTLTRAGQVLATEARQVLDAATAAESRTIRAAQQRSLVVGVKADSAAEFLSAVLDTCAGAPLYLDLEVDFHETHELAAAVRQGRCDVCLVAWPVAETGLDSAELWTEPRVAVLHVDHPLASAGDLKIEDFLAEPVARWPHLPDDLDRFYQGRERVMPGIACSPGPAVTGLAEALRLVELGRTITFLPRSIAHRFGRPKLTVRDVAGLSSSRMFLSWRDRPLAPELENFIEVCRRLAPTAPRG